MLPEAVTTTLPPVSVKLKVRTPAGERQGAGAGEGQGAKGRAEVHRWVVPDGLVVGWNVEGYASSGRGGPGGAV